MSKLPKHRTYWKERGWQWRPNAGRGESFIFEVWEHKSLKLRDGTETCAFDGWRRKCMVYRAHKGDRWVYRSDRTGKTQGFHDLRTAMRMARLLTQLEELK
jgi:hypothetical protein